MPVDEEAITVAEAKHPAKFSPFDWKDYMAHIWRVNCSDYYRQQGSSTHEDDNNLPMVAANMTGNLWQPSLMTKIALTLKVHCSDLLSGRSPNACS